MLSLLPFQLPAVAKIIFVRIIDSYGYGYWASGVLVATEELSPVPCPPALQPETRLILILDQRRILRGFKWYLVPHRLVKVQDIADRFYDICPPRHVVSIRGAEVEEHDSARHFSIVHGQVLVIDFTLETDDAEGDEEPPWDQSPDDHPGRPYLAWVQSDLEPGGGGQGDGGASTQAGIRSRSPRERTRQVAAEGYSIHYKAGAGWACSFHGTLWDYKAQGGHYGKWSHGILHDAKVVGNHDLTPAQTPVSLPSTFCLDATTFVTGGLHFDWGILSSFKVVGHKLLEEPASSPSSLCDRTRAAREATRMLGGEWPFPPFRWPIALPAPEDDDSQEDVQEFGSFVDVAFYLLTPGYIVEQVDMSIVVPQLVGDVLDLVQTCRLAEGRQKFPVLVPVEPQPDPGWGVLLALPAWLRHRTVVCLDLSLFDGRIISADVPANLDFHVLCESAGLSPRADVDIYLPGAQEPLLRGADCLLWTGACVAFRRPGARRHAGFDLEAMLATRAGWEYSPVFPRDRLDNGYCLVSQQGERLFRLQPERAIYYKADIALLTGLHPLRVVVTPASSQPTDISVNGWVCRAVVAATDRQERYNWDGSIDTPTICILDCRAAFLGWGVVHTWESWIDLEPILYSLNQSAPDGWSAAFPGFPNHWTWACVEPGQLIEVVFVPDLPDRRDSGDHDDGDDGHSFHVDSDDDTDIILPEASIARGEERQSSSGGHPNIGGSRSFACSSDGRSGHYGKEMWTAGFTMTGLADGNRQLTPFFICLICVVLLGAGLFPGQRILESILLCVFLRQRKAALGWTLGLVLLINGYIGVAQAGFASDLLPVAHEVAQIPCAAIRALDVPHGAGRPIPTPCRNVFLKTSWPDLGIGPTLLEQAVAERGDDTLRDTRAVLETLFEHFGLEAVNSPEGLECSCHSSVLSLSHLLPSHVTHDVTHVSMLTGISVDAVSSVLGAAWVPDPVLPSGLQWHASTRDALRAHIDYSEGIRGIIEGVDVFTDGSFDGASSWAYVCVASTSAGRFILAWARGVVALPGDDWWIGAEEHSALNGERSAVFWAMSWILGVHSTIPCRLHCDCIVAAFQAAGKFGSSQSDRLAVACRSLAHVLGVLGKFRADTIRHVKGHNGHPYNELADVLAGASAVEVSDIPGHFRPFSAWVAAHVIEWLWLAVASLTQPSVWPEWSHSHFVDPTGNSSLDAGSLTVPDFFGRQHFTKPQAPSHADALYLSAKFVTVNVQSLCEDERSALPNRVPYVRAQLDLCGCVVAGLQETRAVATSTVTSDTHIRFTSARDANGCLGVELWFSRQHPLLWKGSCPVPFEVNDFRVLHWTPRVLVVRYVKGTLRVLFVACHAPTATHPERDEWWKQFADLLSFTIQGDKVVVLGDLNSRLTLPVKGRIGDLLWEDDHPPPDPFFRVLQLGDLWVPSTYTECHSGPSHTWIAPGGASTSRIDYVLLPADWWVPPGTSSVLYHVDFGQTGLDHFAVSVEVHQRCSDRLHFTKPAKRFDVAQACQPESAGVVQALCESLPKVSWATNAHQHYHAVSQHLLDGLVKHFPASRTTRRRPFFSDTTWSLRQQRLWLRRRAHAASAQLQNWDVSCAFQAWTSSVRLCCACNSGFASLLRAVAQLRHASGELRKLRPAFRKTLRQDQQSYIKEIARVAAVSTTKDVVQRLRPLLGPPRRKQRGPAPLPALVLENGEFAATPEEADARWLRHFSAAEQGGPIEPDKMIQRCFNRQATADLEMLEVSARDLPTLWELECALRDSKPGRAAGNDGIPPDILHKYAGQLSTALYPILLKIAFRLQEPLQFKGGTMRHIWKSKGPLEQCSSYRGILVSNTVGKSFHSAFRRRCGNWYDSAATPLQVGGRRGFPVQLAAQAARAYQAGHLGQGNSVAVIFLDLREAFHKVVRPLVHGGDLSDEHIAAVMQSLALGPSHFEELRKYLCADSRLREAGASPWAAAVVKEFQTDSWLTIGNGLAVAEAGTRPGDALADIVFSFLFSAVLRRVRDALLHRGYEVRLPWSDDWFRSLCRASSVGTETLAPIDVSWMDDLALLVSAKSADELVTTVSGASAALLDECLRAMLHPNLDPGKTEALISLAGKGSRNLRGQLFRSAEPSIQVPSLLWPSARVRLVPVYKHLGGLLHWSGSLRPELKTRCAQAWQAFRKQRKLVYGSPTVSHRDKSLIFLSLVATRLLYGVGTWDVTDASYVDKLQGVLIAMSRQMLRTLSLCFLELHSSGKDGSVLPRGCVPLPELGRKLFMMFWVVSRGTSWKPFSNPARVPRQSLSRHSRRRQRRIL
ncbi:hypothetical protein AK812_SmicGene3619 [Symbiodinium microadriaticum]|uniref:RNase H type-1 domain-containing protein n=1 Tax=Symbiodinium microadriaticum TaxID=2951 RepID=A0A1Q9EYK6_SYMMI|nr:hypothetical protein AK812_SmicGene3619 [Symbiodinium microadriaticum]